MNFYLQSENKNEWTIPTEHELQIIKQCIENKEKIYYDSKKMMCQYHKCTWKVDMDPDIFCSLQNWENGLNQKVIWNENNITNQPIHNGAKKISLK